MPVLMATTSKALLRVACALCVIATARLAMSLRLIAQVARPQGSLTCMGISA